MVPARSRPAKGGYFAGPKCPVCKKIAFFVQTASRARTWGSCGAGGAGNEGMGRVAPARPPGGTNGLLGPVFQSRNRCIFRATRRPCRACRNTCGTIRRPIGRCKATIAPFARPRARPRQHDRGCGLARCPRRCSRGAPRRTKSKLSKLRPISCFALSSWLDVSDRDKITTLFRNVQRPKRARLSVGLGEYSRNDENSKVPSEPNNCG